MLVVTVAFEIEPAAASAFLARVRRQARDSLDLEPACHRFDVCVDPNRADRVLLYEIYDDPAAFDAHLASDHFKAFDAEVAPLTRAKMVERWLLA